MGCGTDDPRILGSILDTVSIGVCFFGWGQEVHTIMLATMLADELCCISNGQSKFLRPRMHPEYKSPMSPSHGVDITAVLGS